MTPLAREARADTGMLIATCVASVMATAALAVSLFQLWYSTFRVVEEAGVAVVRHAETEASDGTITETVWLAFSNTGTRPFWVTQAPLWAYTNPGPGIGIAPLDRTDLNKQTQPTAVEPGKLAVIAVSGPIDDVARRETLTQIGADPKELEVRLFANVVAVNPSGQYTNGASKCIRLIFKEGKFHNASVDPGFVRLQALGGPNAAAPQDGPCGPIILALNQTPPPFPGPVSSTR
jgi:hypothetical protein